MSDEPMPPPLRLKPRVQPQPEPAGASISPASELPNPAPFVPSPVEAAAGSKLRLKPKLGANEAAPEPAPAPEPEPTPEPIVPALPPVEPPRAKLKISAAPAGLAASTPAPADIPAEPTAAAPVSDPAAAPPKFKLKTAPLDVRSATEPAGTPTVLSGFPPPPIVPPKLSSTPAPGASLPIPAVARSLTPAPFPVMANTPAPAQTSPAATTPVPHLRAPSNVGEEELLTSLPDARAAAKKRRMIAGLAVLLVLAGGAAYVLLRPEAATPPPDASAPTVAAKPMERPGTAQTPASENATPAASAQKPGPTPSATLNAIAVAPGQAVAKAQAVVDARRQLENDRVDALALGEEPSGKRALNPPPPSTSSGQKAATKAAPVIPVTSTAEVAPGVTATARTSEMVGAASPVFQAWVASARINGVFNGQPPRALVNGRTVRAGQLVDEELGIVFDSLNQAAKTIKFRDRTGAVISRRY